MICFRKTKSHLIKIITLTSILLSITTSVCYQSGCSSPKNTENQIESSSEFIPLCSFASNFEDFINLLSTLKSNNINYRSRGGAYNLINVHPSDFEKAKKILIKNKIEKKTTDLTWNDETTKKPTTTPAAPI